VVVSASFERMLRFVWKSADNGRGDPYGLEVKTATYLRVSTTGQDLEPQRHEIAEYARRRGFGEVTEYSDTISGAKFTRTGLDKFMRDVRKGRITRLLVVKLDRLGRSLPHLAQLIGELDGNRGRVDRHEPRHRHQLG
jgi:DNA invertase Pin-like site-specific DNA recombinase